MGRYLSQDVGQSYLELFYLAVTTGVIEKIWKQVDRAFILARVAIEAMKARCRASIYLK